MNSAGKTLIIEENIDLGCSDDEVDDEYIEFRLTPKDIKYHASTTKKANAPYIGNSMPYA